MACYPTNLYPHAGDSRTRQVVLSWEPTAASAVGTIWEELGKGPRIIVFQWVGLGGLWLKSA